MNFDRLLFNGIAIAVFATSLGLGVAFQNEGSKEWFDQLGVRSSGAVFRAPASKMGPVLPKSLLEESGPIARIVAAATADENRYDDIVSRVAQIRVEEALNAILELKKLISAEQQTSPFIGTDLRLVLSGIVRASRAWPAEMKLKLLNVFDQAGLTDAEYQGLALRFASEIGVLDQKRVQSAWRKVEALKNVRAPLPELEVMSLLDGLKAARYKPKDEELRMLMGHSVYSARSYAVQWICDRVSASTSVAASVAPDSSDLALLQESLSIKPVQARALGYKCVEGNWSKLRVSGFAKGASLKCSEDHSVGRQFGARCDRVQALISSAGGVL